MQTSEHVNELAAAMAKAQAVIRNPAKDKTNPHFRATYADIESGLDVIRPALSSHGIAFFQATDVVDDAVILRTRLIHLSGQWLESSYPVGKLGPHQQMAAALTYAKRQALFALVGVHGEDEDDDGQTAGNADIRQSSAPAQPAKPSPLSKEESATTRDAMIFALEKCETHARGQPRHLQPPYQRRQGDGREGQGNPHGRNRSTAERGSRIMAYEPKDLTGTFRRNERKEKETHPDFTGTARINGVDYWISGWTKQNERGKYMSLAFKPKDGGNQFASLRDELNAKSPQAPARRPSAADELDDSIPF